MAHNKQLKTFQVSQTLLKKHKTKCLEISKSNPNL